MGWFLQVLVLVLSVSVCPSRPDICAYSQCNCTNVAHKWINAVCVFNSTQRQLDMSPDTLPRNLAELEVSGPREMVLDTGSFSRNLSGLYLVKLADIGRLTVERRAFSRLAHPHLRLEVSGVQQVILESSAFSELKGSVVSVKLEKIQRLIIQEHAFDRLMELEIRRVHQLELQPNAFFYHPDPNTENQDPATKITLDHIKVEELPFNVFPSLNRLNILNSEVGVVRNSSFRALILTTVSLVNTTIRRIETEAFTTRSIIGLLELESVTIGQLLPYCVQSGISHLVIRGSSLTEVLESAFYTAAASVSLSENVFNRINSRGCTFREITSLTIERNRFNVLHDVAFVLPEGESGQLINLTFKDNSLGEVGKRVLDFSRGKQTDPHVKNNGFDIQCQCEETTKSWLKEKLNGSDKVIDLFYSTSLCQSNIDLARCFGIPNGSFMMNNFTEIACDADGQYYCPEVVQSDSGVPSFPGMTSGSKFDIGLDRERKVIWYIFIFVISGIIVMLFFSGFMYLRRNGYCTKARLLLLPSAESLLNIISRIFMGSSSSSAPPTRASPHEYAELQQAQKQQAESTEDNISIEDKATQTLPEELTQELLQSLRDKLDDPENYSEARDMIEHLYDLIKVEESCNQNSDFISIQLDEIEDIREGENIYDVIQPKVKTKSRSREKKSLISVGTRAPSPDKLLPLSLTKRKAAVICDYQDPKDRQMHVYQELPATQPCASVLCDYMDPSDTKPHVYQELPSLANRPLPSKPLTDAPQPQL